MALTPEDVRSKRFTPVRLREGYDMGEVDQFLDEVEAELARLTKENDDLRAKLSAAQTGGGSFQDNPPTAQTPAIQEPEPELGGMLEDQAQLGLGDRQPLARSDEERDARPAPVLDLQAERGEGFGR